MAPRRIEAFVLADSRGRYSRVTTLLLQYPRFIHAQVMTYRAWARNSESTRARGPERFLAETLEDPFVPDLWPKEQRGMQPAGYYEDPEEDRLWREECRATCEKARERIARGVHHEIAMRPVEAFMWHRLIVTSDTWDNMLHQRLDPHAQRQFQLLATEIREALAASTPVELKPGEWHIPFDDVSLTEPHSKEPDKRRIMRSVGRCARLSYANHDGNYSADADFELGMKCVRNGHLTPAEHQLKRDPWGEGHFPGWTKLRELIPGEEDALDPRNQTRIASYLTEFEKP